MHTPRIIPAAARFKLNGPRRRGLLAAIAGVGLALLAGCSASAAPPTASSTSNPTANPTASATAASSAPSASSDPSSSGNVSSGNQNGAQGNSGSGTFTLAFAKCMQTHGVPNFPDPDGHAGQLGPGSGIDPSSPQFQAAINGPCLSLAPPGWVGSGKVTP
jgi:hypothetical protein